MDMAEGGMREIVKEGALDGVGWCCRRLRKLMTRWSDLAQVFGVDCFRNSTIKAHFKFKIIQRRKFPLHGCFLCEPLSISVIRSQAVPSASAHTPCQLRVCKLASLPSMFLYFFHIN